MMHMSTGADEHNGAIHEPDAAWHTTKTSGSQASQRGGWLTVGVPGRRRSKIMPLRSRSSDTDPPKPTQLKVPAAEQHPPPPVAEHMTVALVPKASSDLQRTHERTQLSRTDLVNRAISFYEFADAEHHAGSELILRRPTGEEHIVKLL